MKYKNKGFVKMIILIIIVLLVLGVMGFSLRDAIESPTVKDNFSYAWTWVKKSFGFVKGVFDKGENLIEEEQPK